MSKEENVQMDGQARILPKLTLEELAADLRREASRPA